MSEQRSGASTLIILLAALLFLAGGGMLGYVFLGPSGPSLAGLDPARARAGDTITLRGRGFSPTPQGNIVLFGDRTGRVIGATPSELRVEVPDFDVAEGAPQSVAVRVLVGKRASGPVDLTAYREVGAIGEVEPLEPAAEPTPTPEPEVVAVVPPPSAETGVAPARPARPAPRPKPTPPPPVVSMAAELPKPAPPEPAVPPAARRFVLERTAVQSNKRISGDLEGFDSSGVDLKRAPEVVGRVYFEVTPQQVKPGDRYTVNVFLINEGARPIQIKQMFVATSVNGRLSSGPMPASSNEVGPKQRALIGNFTDAWRDTTSSWAMDVTVTSDKGDVYKNQIAWK
jgi:hypothetical protein